MVTKKAKPRIPQPDRDVRMTRSAGRELISPHGDKRYVRRDAQGRFIESDDVGRSLSADKRKAAKRAVPAGQGDKGDRKKK